MHPVLFEVFGFELYTFGALVALAFVFAFFWMFRRAKAVGDDPNIYLDAAVWLIIAALVGARLFYILFFPEIFWADPLGTLFGQGGLVWYGGMVGVILAVLFFTKRRGLNLWRFSDVMVPPAALGLAIGRIGCFMAGCCFGGPCEVSWLAVYYPHSHPSYGIPVYPTQLLESAAMFATALGLGWFSSRQKFPGQTTWLFFIIYGFVRFGLEYIRGDRLVWLDALDLSASQVISLVGIALGCGMLWFLGRRVHA
jgi:phosphatidylglycerol:prolipoprotein diacylglycerol transferase